MVNTMSKDLFGFINSIEMKYPQLTPAAEKHFREVLSSESSTKKDKLDARNRLVFGSIKYVASKVLKDERLGSNDAMDVVMNVVKEMLAASEKYDAGKNVKFISYMNRIIDNAITDSLSPFTKNDRNLYKDYTDAKNKLEREGKPITDALLAEKMGVKESTVYDFRYRTANVGTVSFDAPLGDDEGETASLGDLYIEKTLSTPEEQAVEAAGLKVIMKALELLPQRFREELLMSTNYNGSLKSAKSTREIGALLGVTHATVSNDLKKAREIFRQNLADLDYDIPAGFAA